MFSFMKKKDADTPAAGKAQKSKGFYLELDEAASIAPASKPAATPSPAVVTPEVVAPPAVAAVPEAVVAETKVELAPEPTAPAKAPKASKKAPEPNPAPAPAPTPEPVAEVVPEPETIPAYLVMNNTPRRRPGANMAMFKSMAQQVGSSKN